jgi:hypothetical protein
VRRSRSVKVDADREHSRALAGNRTVTPPSNEKAEGFSRSYTQRRVMTAEKGGNGFHALKRLKRILTSPARVMTLNGQLL